MLVLITGGAGYIGSFANRVLLEKGLETVVLDNFTAGHRGAVPHGAPFVRADLNEMDTVRNAFRSYRFDAVLHFAAHSLVGESVEHPLEYYRNNVAGTVNLLSAMKAAGVRKFVFSSSAALYGNPTEIPIDEHHRVMPINPYGRSKAMIEQILEDCASAWGLKTVALRYFNAAGASPNGDMGEDHRNETHLIPLILRAAMGTGRAGEPVRVFGTDYDTPDGTCLRDYIHVIDLAEAHVLALDWMERVGGCTWFNLGNERGFSVLEIIRVCEEVTGISIPWKPAARRSGDPAILVASSKKIRRELGWSPRYSEIRDIVRTAWLWHSSHSRGYGD
ncbi:MAG: UDP-glucose 4-epimerase GalE [Deltaproteobacteria bacterium]|nr:UDP-glucose 4-epimerase GalE [Deltaproteobacteria bacterium]